MRYKRVFVFCLIAACNLRYFTACKRSEEKLKPVFGSVTESVYASGTIKSKDQYQVFAQANGLIEQVFVKEGDTVKKGQPLLFISNDIQRLTKENAELAARFADLPANQSKLVDAKAFSQLAREKMQNDSLLYTRQAVLWQQNIGTRVELEQRELAYKNAKTSYLSSLLKLEDLERQLEFNSSQAKKNLLISGTSEKDFTVRSELDGMVYSLNKVKGEMVSMQTPLAVVGNARIFILEMQVDEYDIAKIKKGLVVLVTMDAYRGQVFEAKVSRIFPLMNERSKTFVVEAQFTKAPAIVYPNTSFEANIVISQKQNALVIPRNYMLNDSTVINGKGQNLIVKTGLKDYQFIEIVSGIGINEELAKPN